MVGSTPARRTSQSSPEPRLILVALSCILFVPAGTFFVWTEASHTGEMYLFSAAFLAGMVAGWACVLVFGRPIRAALRGERGD